MYSEEEVREIAEQAVKAKGAVLIGITMGADNRIQVVVDSSKGVNLKDLSDINRAIENGLDRERQDFSLEVTSPGADKPFVIYAQFEKNLNRKVEVLTHSGEKIQGTMTAVNPRAITLEYKERIPKEKGKGKRTVERKSEIVLDDINQARAILSFK